MSEVEHDDGPSAVWLGLGAAPDGEAGVSLWLHARAPADIDQVRRDLVQRVVDLAGIDCTMQQSEHGGREVLPFVLVPLGGNDVMTVVAKVISSFVDRHYQHGVTIGLGSGVRWLEMRGRSISPEEIEKVGKRLAGLSQAAENGTDIA